MLLASIGVENAKSMVVDSLKRSVDPVAKLYIDGKKANNKEDDDIKASDQEPGVTPESDEQDYKECEEEYKNADAAAVALKKTQRE